MKDAAKKLFKSVMVNKDNNEIESIIRESDFGTLSIQKEDGKTALHCAVINRNLVVTKLLLDRGVKLDVQDKSGKTALHFAVEKELKDIVFLLLKEGASPNILDTGNISPLHLAAILGNEEITRILLEKGAEPNIKDNDDQTPLYLAAGQNYAKVGKILLDHGADPSIEARTSSESTPLELLLDFNKSDTKEFALLLLRSDKVNTENIETGALDFAKIDFADLLDTNHIDLIQALFKDNIKSYDESTIFTKFKNSIQNGANKENIISLLNNYKITPELKAELLLDMENIDIHAIGKKGYTPLHTAAFNGEAFKVKYLIEKDANKNALDKTGGTILHSARTVEVAEILLKNGANINAQKYNEGKFTPLDVILLSTDSVYDVNEIEKQKQLAEFLINKGANLTTCNNPGKLKYTITKLLKFGIDQKSIIASLKNHNALFDEKTKIDIIKNIEGFDKKSIISYHKLGVDMKDMDEKQLNIIVKDIASGKDKDDIAALDIFSYNSSDLVQNCFFNVLMDYDQDTAKLIGNDIF